MASSTPIWNDVRPDRFHQLCSLCVRIVRNSHIINSYAMDNRLEFSADIQEEVFPFYAGLDLEISARKWCHLCSLLWRCLDEDSWKRLRIGNAEDPLVSQRVKFQVLVGRPSTVIRIGLVCAEPDAAALAYLGPDKSYRREFPPRWLVHGEFR